ncbi:MAG: TonB-dependent receptor [Vicinamibacterales bacterium]|nr:TonB-dependent receptor [Vicinamibacterales bacterium]
MRYLIRSTVLALLCLGIAPLAFAQSQSINGTIEGTVRDDSGGVLPGVSVTLTNTDTGSSRTVVTNESGFYRAPLLPLGAYRVSAELAGFKTSQRTGIALSAGQSAVIDVVMGVGDLSEVVSVTADAPLVDVGRIDQGRTLNEREIKELPLTSRNPYNFALLQPGVVGFETQEFGVPRLTANGALLRINYQIDGNDNTQKDRAGLRQMPMSEVMIREVKVITTGYAPEFGQTMGLIYNAITPSGTNRVKGQASYRFQEDSFAAQPFFSRAAKPPVDVDMFTIDLGGPIVRDKTHFFAGFENTKRDLSGNRVITISPANQTALGLSEPGYMPAVGDTKFVIGKLDHQVSGSNRATLRYIFFDNFISNNIGGGLNSVQRGTDFKDRQHSVAAQLVSTFGANVLNELRVQYAGRDQSRVPGADAGTGPAIAVSGAANFGGPVATAADAGFGFTQNIFQVIDNFTFIRGDHAVKLGFSYQHVQDTRTIPQSQQYTFASVANYLAAKSGTNPFAYSTFTQYFGAPGLEYTTRMFAVFAQDDWRVSPRVKLLYGLRYDLAMPPEADGAAPLATSRTFTTDKNNLQPRVGLVWNVTNDQRTVVRANSGLMYDQPLNAIYEQALQNNGTNARASATFSPTTAGAPAFPAVLSAGSGAQPNSAATVDPDFSTARSWQNNVQVEKAVGQGYAIGLGASYVKFWNLPVITNINPINPTGTLADGRPIFSAAVSAATRLDPRYNVINMVQALGDGDHKAMTVQLTRRFSKGFQFDLAYTLGKSTDNAPLTGTLSVQGDTGGRSDMTRLEVDRGPHILDQRHTLAGSVVAQPTFNVDGVLGTILNHNQFGIALQFASGIPVNVRSNRELNNDATGSDRPVGVSRNSLNLPARKNVDLRYSRKFPVRGTVELQLTAEVKNLFNTVQWAGVNSVVATDTLGVPLSAIPTAGDGFPATSGYEQRQLQLGVKVIF